MRWLLVRRSTQQVKLGTVGDRVPVSFVGGRDVVASDLLVKFVEEVLHGAAHGLKTLITDVFTPVVLDLFDDRAAGSDGAPPGGRQADKFGPAI